MENLRPGGPLYGQPVQSVDGVWYDQFGKPFESDRQRDLNYASRFWRRQPPGMKNTMEENIRQAEKAGTFNVFVDRSGITEYDKEKLSAYRELAQQMGYKIGQFQYNERAWTVSAPIEKSETSV